MFVKVFLPFLFLFSLLIACKTKKPIARKPLPPADSLAMYPYWIDMMADTTVNYNDAVYAFETYWKDKTPPTAAHGEGREVFNSSDKVETEKPPYLDLVVEYKQFLTWQRKYQHLTKPDGTILTPEEIKKITEKD